MRILLIFLFSGCMTAAFAQKTIVIETDHFAQALQVDEASRLRVIYFGKKLVDASSYALIAAQSKKDDLNSGIQNVAYTPAGTWNLSEPALQMTHADGNTSTELQYVDTQIEKTDDNVQTTRILLRDPVYKTEVTLFYKVYRKEDVVEQWSVISNKEKGGVVMEKYASANLYFTAKDYYLKHYHGNWAKEMKPEETLLSAGIHTLDSKLGTRADLFQPPSFMLSFDQPATEDAGEVLLANLSWSGNFKMDFEMDPYHHLRLVAGINPFASAYTLQTGEAFTTPALVYTYSETGVGTASRNLHRWARNYRIPDGNGFRLTLLNNWESTYFDFDEQKITGLFTGAEKLGVDMFLLDDGWFANKYPRNDDKAGLGDWQENKKKLPNGLGYLVKAADEAGVKFGIWVEPEMVNPKSELYEKHRDWVIREPERPEHYFRNQLVLDLSNPEVQDFVFGVLDQMFTQHPGIAFVKWDCNAVIYNAHSAYLEKQKKPQTQLYVDYVKGLYKVLDRLRAKYPKVPMMLCSGGGGRVDYGALKYFTEFWLSDNTDPLERVFIQWENGYFFPAIAHCNHVTDWSKIGIKYRTDVAMMGKMGYDIVVDHLSADDLAFSQQAIKNYHSITDAIWHGDQYRLVSPWDNPYAAIMYVDTNRDHAAAFYFVVTNRFDYFYSIDPVKFKGLDPAKRYKLKELNIYPNTKSSIDETAVYTGDFLMNIGINPDLTGNRRSVVIDVAVVK